MTDSLVDLIEHMHGVKVCPAIIARPGVSASRQCLQVLHGVPINYLLDNGFVFPRIVWSVDQFNTTTILRDDGVGGVPRLPAVPPPV